MMRQDILGVVVELAFASEPPSTAASRISFPLPQQALLVPQHHFADVAVPSHGDISPLELTSTSCNEIRIRHSDVKSSSPTDRCAYALQTVRIVPCLITTSFTPVACTRLSTFLVRGNVLAKAIL